MVEHRAHRVALSTATMNPTTKMATTTTVVVAVDIVAVTRVAAVEVIGTTKRTVAASEVDTTISDPATQVATRLRCVTTTTPE